MSNDMTPDSPMTGSTNRLIAQTEGWTPAQYCAKWAALERELVALDERLAETEQSEQALRDELEHWEGRHCGGDCLAAPCGSCDGTLHIQGEGQRLKELADEATERAQQAEQRDTVSRDALDYLYGLTPERVTALRQAERELGEARKDAGLYQFLRDDDNWCDDGPLTWEALGELSGAEFDAFVDAKRAERDAAREGK